MSSRPESQQETGRKVTESDLKENIKDQWWRLNNLYWIIDEKGNKVRFRPNAVQARLYNEQWYLNIILKSRQHGITTFLCILFLDTCLTNSNIHAGIIAHNREDAEAFFQDKITYAYNNLPSTIRLSLKAETQSARELAFSNGSSIRVGTSLRSSTNQLLHISEFGKLCAKFPEKAREVVTGALNTVHQGQQIYIESTAEGKTGYFYDYCNKAMELQTRAAALSPLDFKFFFFAWYDDPKNALQTGFESVIIPQETLIYFDDLEQQGIHLTPQQKAWYVLKLDQQGDDMKREHPSTPQEAFEAVSAQCFFLGSLDGHSEVQVGEFGNVVEVDGSVSWQPTPKGITEIWQMPFRMQPGFKGGAFPFRYCIGSDISEGLGGDYSVAYVFDRYERKFVASMVSNTIDSYKWADRLIDLSQFFENAFLVPERNGAGITTINRLLEREFRNLYMKEVIAGVGGKQVEKKYGWQETKESKQSICGSLKSYFGELDDYGRRKNAIPCRHLLHEASVFVKDEEAGKMGAEPGSHDDRVIAAALALAGDLFLPSCEHKPVVPKLTQAQKHIEKQQNKGKGGYEDALIQEAVIQEEFLYREHRRMEGRIYGDVD